MEGKSTCVPVLFILFNKVEETKLVFNAIRSYKPDYLYISADGPRLSVVGEKERCEEIQAWVLAHVDWDCTVSTFFRKENVGCGKGPSQAISWFFSQVEEGIILEDDCLPNESFFDYCSVLLEKFRYDTRISAISGNNFQPGNTTDVPTDYYFSVFPSSWGWASWRRAWTGFEFTISQWEAGNKNRLLKYLFYEAGYRLWWKNQFDWMAINQPEDMWDFQFHFLSMFRQQLAIIPRVNLVSNIGHGVHGTHFNDPGSSLANLPTYELVFPLRHPSLVTRNYQADVYVQNLLFGRTEPVTMYKNTKRLIKKILHIRQA